MESPPWGGWCPILARGGALALGVAGDSVFFLAFGFGLSLVRVLYIFFCLSRPILPPEIFESGKNIGLDPLSLVKYGVGDVFFTAGSCELPILAS